MNPDIKFYRVTGSGWDSPIYYAAYNVENVEKTAYSDNNSQFLLQIYEVIYEYIPTTSFIRNAGLNYNDAHSVALLRL